MVFVLRVLAAVLIACGVPIVKRFILFGRLTGFDREKLLP